MAGSAGDVQHVHPCAHPPPTPLFRRHPYPLIGFPYPCQGRLRITRAASTVMAMTAHLLERDTELASLRHAFAAAAAGQGAGIAISGESGAGKSTLALAALEGLRGFLVSVGSANCVDESVV